MRKMDQKQTERWRKVRANGRRYFLWRGAFISFLYLLLGATLWRLFRIYVTGNPLDFLYERLDNVIAIGFGFSLWGYLQARTEWDKNEREYASLSTEEDTAMTQSAATC